MDRLVELPPSVQRYLSDFVVRWRRLVTLRAAGTALAVIAIWIPIACTIDRFLHLPGTVRLASLVGVVLLAITISIYRLRRIRGPVDWVAMAAVIEEHDPDFQQSLITVISRLLGPPEFRGSDDILSHLLRQVEHRVSANRARRLLTFRSVGLPWLVLLIGVASFIAIARVPGMGVPRLLGRQIEPLADIPPVTTTSLTVRPGNADVMQSEPFQVQVDSLRLGNKSVELYINDDGVNWTHYPMDDAGHGLFIYAINAVGRDLLYKVTGGDAVAGPFTVRVKRPPAVAEYRFHYTYPTYTRRPPATFTNTDGTIEAPSGTEAVLTIVATEPLQSALLTIGSQKTLMTRAGSDLPNVRQATFRIQNDASYDLDLISTREVRGGAGKLQIRAASDHPPLVRLYQAGQVLRLNPRDVLPLAYQAMDDYGLEDVAIVAEINADEPRRIPLRLTGDRRRQDQTVNFDLGSLHFKIGDVVSLTIAAHDTAGQETDSDELLILIAPRSIDLDAHERIEELRSGLGLATSLADEFDAAGKANEDVEAKKDHPTSPACLAAEARVTRHLTSASEAATFLRQAILRAAAHSDSAELSRTLADWADSVHRESKTADDLFHSGYSSEGMSNGSRDRLRRASDAARELTSQIRTVFVGELAACLTTDRQDLRASLDAHSFAEGKNSERLGSALKRVNDEIVVRLTEIGVNTSAPDVDSQLAIRMDATRALERSKQPIDFAAAAREWSQDLQKDPHRHIGLDARLAIAAEVEAVRPDADLECARDLELAARAAGAIESTINQTLPGKPVSPGKLNEFAASLEALQRLHRMKSDGGGPHSADEIRIARNVADHARDEITRWSGEAKNGKNAPGSVRSTELESLALRAGADSADHDYKHVAEADRALVQKLSDAARNPGGRSVSADVSSAASQIVEERIAHIQQAADEVTQNMSTAQTVDRLGQTEEKLLDESRSAKTAARDLAGRQRSVANEIADVEREQARASFESGPASGDMDDPNWRGRATAALLLAQEQLAAMPRELSAVQDADTARRKASDRAIAARHDVTGADAERLPMATRAADQAEQDARDAAVQLDEAIAPVLPAVAGDLAERLEPFSPEASDARGVALGSLTTALGALQSACHDNNPDDVARATGDALKSIDSAQHALRLAQEEFTARDPLIAAKWFARAAADSLAHHPTDLRTALAHQANVSSALSRAWDHSIHRAAELRLAELPSLQSVYAPLPPGPAETATAALTPGTNTLDWAHLHARDNDDLTATLQDPDPPGYEEPLRLYFEALGKAQEKPK